MIQAAVQRDPTTAFVIGGLLLLTLLHYFPKWGGMMLIAIALAYLAWGQKAFAGQGGVGG